MNPIPTISVSTAVRTLLLVLAGCASAIPLLMMGRSPCTIAGVHPGMPVSEARRQLESREAAWDHLSTAGPVWTASTKGCAGSSFRLRVDTGPHDRVAAVVVQGSAVPLFYEGERLWTREDHLTRLGPPSAVRRGVLVYDAWGLEARFEGDGSPAGWSLRGEP